MDKEQIISNYITKYMLLKSDYIATEEALKTAIDYMSVREYKTDLITDETRMNIIENKLKKMGFDIKKYIEDQREKYKVKQL